MQDFELSLVEGELLIRDAEEALVLEGPLSIAGDHDTGEGGTGAVTNGDWTSPTVSFETEAQGFPVFVDATFTDASPATGTIDADGNVVLNVALNVHLDIDVNDTDPPLLHGDCSTGPVNLTLESNVPWNPDTKQVTLRDTDFTVPALPLPTPACIDVITDGVNAKLAGPGSSIEMTFQGDLELPTAATCKTLTTLDVTPDGESRLGDEVSFTATVIQDPAFADEPACDEVEDGQIPAGIVEFKAGTTVLGTSPLDGTGTATFTTDGIAAGTFPLTAGYRGEPPFGKSTSPAVTHKVATKVAVTADIPHTVVIQGDYAEFDITLTNTSLGSTVINARPQITLKRREIGQILLASQVDIEYWNGSAWVPSPASGSATVLAALSDDEGFPLGVGQEVTRKVRLGFGHNSVPTPASLDVTVEVVEVDPATGLPAPAVPPSDNAVGQATGVTYMVESARRPTTTTATLAPHTLRQGQTARLDIATSGEVNGLNPGGTWTVLLDGDPVAIRADDTPAPLGRLPSIPARSVGSAEFPIPDDMGTGVRVVTLRYSGDQFFAPSEWSSTLYVLASRGTTYSCDTQLINADAFYVNMVARANLGSVRPSGGTVNLSQLDINMYVDRGNGPFIPSFFDDEEFIVPPETEFLVSVQAIGFGFAGGAGAGAATSVTTTNKAVMDDSTRPVDPDPDMVIGFNGETGSVVIEGAPGDVVPITLDSVNITASFYAGGPPFPIPLNCTPVGEPINLGDVTIAGTTLTVDAPTPTREGDDVTMNVKVAPVGTAGTVEFRDGTDTLTVKPVRSDGTVEFTTDALAAGVHELSARFFGGLAANSTASALVALTVLAEFDCPAFVEEGSGAVVRLVYMELLGRCPDQAGYDHWVGQLDGGTSAETFARTISRTTEAVGQVVDDAYETMLGRAPDAGGRAFWVGRLQASGRYDQLLADLAGSAEFWSLSGSSNAGFVTRVYERLLDRVPEPAGLDYWVGRLDGGTSRKVLVRSLANLDEPLGRLVVESYAEILGRAPSSGERSDGIDHLRDTGNRSGLYAQLIGRPEFDDRAQDFPNPED